MYQKNNCIFHLKKKCQADVTIILCVEGSNQNARKELREKLTREILLRSCKIYWHKFNTIILICQAEPWQLADMWRFEHLQCKCSAYCSWTCSRVDQHPRAPKTWVTDTAASTAASITWCSVHTHYETCCIARFISASFIYLLRTLIRWSSVRRCSLMNTEILHDNDAISAQLLAHILYEALWISRIGKV